GTERFTSEDLLGFRGRDAEFYRYLANDPVDARDPAGTKELGAPLTLADIQLAQAVLAEIKHNNPTMTDYTAWIQAWTWLTASGYSDDEVTQSIGPRPPAPKLGWWTACWTGAIPGAIGGGVIGAAGSPATAGASFVIG